MEYNYIPYNGIMNGSLFVISKWLLFFDLIYDDTMLQYNEHLVVVFYIIEKIHRFLRKMMTNIINNIKQEDMVYCNSLIKSRFDNVQARKKWV